MNAKLEPWFTEESLAYLQEANVDRAKDYGWNFVSHTQLSIARHYGGATVNGQHYVYDPRTDELIRPDVLKKLTAWRKRNKKPPLPEPTQGEFALGDHREPEVRDENGVTTVTLHRPDSA